MARPGAFIPYSCTAAIAAHRIVAHKPGNDFTVDQAASVATAFAGVSDHGSTKTNKVDVIHDRTALIEYGGDVATGDPLTSDSTGRGIKFDPASHAEDAIVWIVGVAQEAGSEGTIGTTSVSPFMIVK